MTISSYSTLLKLTKNGTVLTLDVTNKPELVFTKVLTPVKNPNTKQNWDTSSLVDNSNDIRILDLLMVEKRLNFDGEIVEGGHSGDTHTDAYARSIDLQNMFLSGGVIECEIKLWGETDTFTANIEKLSIVKLLDGGETYDDGETSHTFKMTLLKGTDL